MVRVGVAGMGMMGQFHLRAYEQIRGASVVAIAESDPNRRKGAERIAGNLEDARGDTIDIGKLRVYDNAREMAAAPDIDVLDLCLPTPEHVPVAIAALRAGKHVLIEKPFARTAREALRAVRAAEKAQRVLMVAHCLRFWPEYLYAERLIRSGKYGRVLSASFWRLGILPQWSSRGWMIREDEGGGVPLDLQIHDLDVAQWFFGPPKAITSQGVVREGPGVVHASTRLEYAEGPVVTCEASWLMPASYGFRSGFTLVFENASVVVDSSRRPVLELFPKSGKKPLVPRLPAEDAYLGELRYFINCVRRSASADRVPAGDMVNAVRMAEAVIQSARTGRKIRLA